MAKYCPPGVICIENMTLVVVFILILVVGYVIYILVNKQDKLSKINQHSIGLKYIKIALAINDEDYKEEFEVWNKYFENVINKDKAEVNGFFWAVQEIKLIENSAVLFGSNEVTPTLDNNVKIEPSADTQKEQSVEETIVESTKSNRRRFL